MRIIPLSPLKLLLFALVVLVSSKSAQAANVYIVVSSSVSYDSASNKVNGVSQTTMDYRTTLYYLGRATGKLYTQDLNNPIAVQDVQGAAGQSVVTAQTQATASPYTVYNLKTYHYLWALPCALAGCPAYQAHYDYFNYYYSSPNAYIGAPSEFGQTQTIYGCDPGPYATCYPNFVYDWIWMGNTNHSVRTPRTLTITNPFVTGNLSNSNQNSLIGANVILTAAVNPNTGGNYSWTFDAPVFVVGPTNFSTVTFRSLQTGNLTVTVTFTANDGAVVTSWVKINSILPTLTQFTASIDPDVVAKNQGCDFVTGDPGTNAWTYSLGCFQRNGPFAGIVFTAKATIPSQQYLSDPQDSGIKIRQFSSSFRRHISDLNNGNFECSTARNPYSDIDSGWQLDGGEALGSVFSPPTTFFNNNTGGIAPNIEYRTLDSPLDALAERINGVSFVLDVDNVADEFDTYVDYFTGPFPTMPDYKRPLRLVTENNFLYSHIRWRWNGQAIFAWDSSVGGKYVLQFTNSTQTVAASGINFLPSYHGSTDTLTDTPCIGDPAPSLNRTDGALLFVLQQYNDMLGFFPDQVGWDFWTFQIASCALDRNCIYGNRAPGAYHGKRTDVAKTFFDVAPFQQTDPAMANPPGSPGFNPAVYNRAFVRHCYLSYLQREPDQGGWDFWTNNLNSTSDYLGVIDAFVTSDAYRARFGPITPRPW